MAFSQTSKFTKRRHQIIRDHRAIARRGGELHMGPDGLLTVRRKRGSSGVPYRGLFILAGVLFVAKALMLAHDGAQTYGERIVALAESGAVGRAAAWIMQADPLTRSIADYLAPLLG
ncbi:hypothetical protein [Oceaniglobus ichthyenteri]|uniref:hypothetical protein n=1 Tax=Oceaniglobus ichthyenteri TaxID=2136177 RepID=UPI000D33AA84|nr:hypothetical protein [Oceaniglobus ichthyenteri]